jgi:putative colanic acid biosynthesis acetyltransferase WcaF
VAVGAHDLRRLWIGEDAWLLNLEPITLEHDVCLSQGAMPRTGSQLACTPGELLGLQPGTWPD